jgi:tRNA pseudouridine38-40 synthase
MRWYETVTWHQIFVYSGIAHLVAAETFDVVSLKMIVEDEDIIQKINAELSPQIRVWGYEVTSKSWMRWYETVTWHQIFVYSGIAHLVAAETFAGHFVAVELADKAGELDAVKTRQEEVASYWEEVDEKYIKPILLLPKKPLSLLKVGVPRESRPGKETSPRCCGCLPAD